MLERDAVVILALRHPPNISLAPAVAHMVGVSHLPELQFLTLRSTDKYIVVCSDGISQVPNRTSALHGTAGGKMR